MSTIFIIERPTQIITAITILEQLRIKNEGLIIAVNRFNDAKNIVDRFNEVEKTWSFELTENYQKAINQAAKKLPAHLFIHWDVGFRMQNHLRQLRKLNKNNKISVFEEGIGTYRQDIYPPLKKRIFRLLKLPTNIGGSKYIDDVYIYDKKRYISNAHTHPKETIEIYRSLETTIRERHRTLNYIFSSENFIRQLSEKHCRDCQIYLSNWNFSNQELTRFSSKGGIKVLKLHPHCETDYFSEDVLIAPKSLPAELLISAASQLFRNVTVYHKGSSVPLYIKSKNVKFVIATNRDNQQRVTTQK